MRLSFYLFFAASLVAVLPMAQVPLAKNPRTTPPSCSDAVFKIQSNFWVNLHLFVRAESRRRGMKAPVQMPSLFLNDAERVKWEPALDVYDGMARRSLIFDEGLVQTINALANMDSAHDLPSNIIETQIATALNGAAPIYRAHLWPEHQEQDNAWIAAHCSDIKRFDRGVKEEIATIFKVTPPHEPILVDLARETGPTLAYTTGGPAGTAGHTVIAPQQNSNAEIALDTIFHEISHTMVDDQITQLIDREGKRQGVRPPDDLWHAVTLYTTWQITRQVLVKNGRPTTRLDADSTKMFERGGWQSILTALQKDWQPYLDRKTSFSDALARLVRDTAKR